jgi:hypothetical protein
VVPCSPFPDISPERQSLAKRNPALNRKTILDHRTLIPEYCRPVAAFFGMASGAFAAAVPQGWTQGTRPASSSLTILVVISS